MKCTEPTSGGYYYPEHLPLLGEWVMQPTLICVHVHVCALYMNMYMYSEHVIIEGYLRQVYIQCMHISECVDLYYVHVHCMCVQCHCITCTFMYIHVCVFVHVY